ncbi:MAG TPA: hypothetical protein VI111_04400 [Thermoleophilaceae bacterium]
MPDDYLAKSFTPEKQAAAFKRISHAHGMPIDTRVRPRMEATVPACRAVVAARRARPLDGRVQDEARERLERVATEQHVGFDGFWTLA